jgi:hypothetical protein
LTLFLVKLEQKKFPKNSQKFPKNFLKIFQNLRLLLNSGKSLDFHRIVESLKTLSYLDFVLCSMNRPLDGKRLFVTLNVLIHFDDWNTFPNQRSYARSLEEKTLV